MEKYIRVYKAIIRMNIASLFAYRAHFISGVIATLGWSLFQVIWIYLLTSRVTTAYGWSRDELIFLALGYVLFIGFFHMLFSHNFEEMATIINKGELDGYLLRPIDSSFLLTCLRIRISNITRFIVGIVLMVCRTIRVPMAEAKKGSIMPIFVSVSPHFAIME